MRTQDDTSGSPRLGKWLLRPFMNREDYHEIVANFDEAYKTRRDQHGIVRASLWFWFILVKSIPAFFMDLLDMPDKVEKVLEMIAPHLTEIPCRQALNGGFPAIWVGGWRTAPFMMSPGMWNRFAWPFFKQLVQEVVERGLIAILHLDSNWDRELARFKELPQGKAVLALDGETDIFKAKNVLGEHLCIMGDVPPALLAFGTPAEVNDYCRKLIRELGPHGFILQSGCDIPANAKVENVQAMVSAALN